MLGEVLWKTLIIPMDKILINTTLSRIWQHRKCIIQIIGSLLEATGDLCPYDSTVITTRAEVPSGIGPKEASVWLLGSISFLISGYLEYIHFVKTH